MKTLGADGFCVHPCIHHSVANAERRPKKLKLTLNETQMYSFCCWRGLGELSTSELLKCWIDCKAILCSDDCHIKDVDIQRRGVKTSEKWVGAKFSISVDFHFLESFDKLSPVETDAIKHFYGISVCQIESGHRSYTNFKRYWQQNWRWKKSFLTHCRYRYITPKNLSSSSIFASILFLFWSSLLPCICFGLKNDIVRRYSP